MMEGLNKHIKHQIYLCVSVFYTTCLFDSFLRGFENKKDCYELYAHIKASKGGAISSTSLIVLIFLYYREIDS